MASSVLTALSRVHTDPRLTACARALRIARPNLCLSLVHVWGVVLEQGSTHVPVAVVAAALGRKPDRVAKAMVDSCIAVLKEDGGIDLEPLAVLYGEPCEEDTELSQGNLEQDGLSSVRARERAKKSRQRAKIKVAREAGTQGDMSPGQVLDNAGDTGGHVPGTSPSPLPPPITPPNTPSPENPPHRAGARDPGHGDAGTGLGQYTMLYEKHRAVIAEVAPPGKVALLGAVNVLHKIRECLNHPAIREQEPAAIERALELLGVQAKAKADAGETDPWWLLENAWSPGVLEKALKCPDEETARRRAVRRTGAKQDRPGVRTAPNEHYQDKGIGECEI